MTNYAGYNYTGLIFNLGDTKEQKLLMKTLIENKLITEDIYKNYEEEQEDYDLYDLEDNLSNLDGYCFCNIIDGDKTKIDYGTKKPLWEKRDYLIRDEDDLYFIITKDFSIEKPLSVSEVLENIEKNIQLTDELKEHLYYIDFVICG